MTNNLALKEEFNESHELLDSLSNPPSVKSGNKPNFNYYKDTNGELRYMENKLEYVKVKIQSLADEAKFIRKQEHKQKTKYKDIVLRNALANKSVGEKIGKWTVSLVTNDTVTLTRTINDKKIGNIPSVRLISKQVNMRWNPKPETHQTAVNTFWGLRHHRVTVVRDEARASHIAYGFLRGKKYKEVENARIFRKSRYGDFWDYHFKATILPRVCALAIKYTQNKALTSDDVVNWIKASF